MQMKAEGGRPRVCEKSGNYEDEGPQTEESGGGRGGAASFFTGTLGQGAHGASRRGIQEEVGEILGGTTGAGGRVSSLRMGEVSH